VSDERGTDESAVTNYELLEALKTAVAECRSLNGDWSMAAQLLNVHGDELIAAVNALPALLAVAKAASGLHVTNDLNAALAALEGGQT
jgi:hypothetical protein